MSLREQIGMDTELTTVGKPGNNLFAIIFLLFISLQVYLVASTRLYPFLDTPNHLAIATIYRYYGEPTNQFANYYTIDTFLKPNIFHLLFCGLPLFPSVEFANKIFYCLYVLLFPLSILLVIKKMGGNLWFSLISFLFLYNINVLYGFNGFVIALPFVMFSFYCMLNYQNKQRVSSGIMIALLLVLLFFMHALAALFTLLVICASSFVSNKKSIFSVAKSCMPVLPVVTLIAAWWYRDSAQYHGASLASFLLRYYTGEYFKTFYLRGGFLIFDNFRLLEGISGYALALLFSLFVIGLVAMGLFLYNRRPKNSKMKSNVKLLITFMICSVSVYSLMPESLPGYSFLFERFSVFILISFILLGSVLFTNSLKRAVPSAICIMCLIHFLLWADYFRDFDRENRMFNREFFSSISNDKRLAGLMYDYRFRGRSVYENFADYFVVWKQGITNTRVIDDRSFPVQRKTSKEILPPDIEWSGKHDSYDGSYSSMDYILVRGELSTKARHYLVDFKVIQQAGMWSLFEKATSRAVKPD